MQLHAVGERGQTGRRVVPIQTEVQREVVARSGRDHQERHAAFGGDAGDQSLRSVPTGDAEQIRPVGDGGAGNCGDVHPFRAAQQPHPGAERHGLLRQPEPDHFAATGARIHDQKRSTGRRRFVLAHPAVRAPQRGPGRDAGEQPERHRQQDDPEEMSGDVDDRDRRYRQHGDADREDAGDAPSRRGPPQTGQDDDQAADADREQDETAQSGKEEWDGYRADCAEQGAASRPPAARRNRLPFAVVRRRSLVRAHQHTPGGRF